jgi:hypothetical protein
MSEVHLRRIAAALEAIAEQDGQRFAQRFADDVEKPAEVDEGELLRFLLMHSRTQYENVHFMVRQLLQHFSITQKTQPIALRLTRYPGQPVYPPLDIPPDANASPEEKET